MAAVNISKMTKSELLSLRTRIDRALSKIDEKNLQHARREARQLAKSYGVSVVDLLGAKPAPKEKKKSGGTRRGKVAPKYRNPKNAGETWTGRGRQPRWFAEAIAGGATLASLEIS